jgi:2-C-methyl-D-erythritol 4-phosphate cytidylyltransferase
MATVGAVIVGAGRASRMNGLDKVFAPLGGRPVLAYSLDAFETSPLVTAIVIVLSETNLAHGRAMVRDGGWRKVVALVPGGARRQDSTRAGLTALPPCDLVAVHDAARPLVTADLIGRGIKAAVAVEGGGAVAAVPVKDTIKRVGTGGRVLETPPRAALHAAQTPQIAWREALDRALAAVDAPVVVFTGSYRNLKVTTPEDLVIATALLNADRGPRTAE